LPLIGSFPKGSRPDAGLKPDVLVVPTVSDIAQGRDAEMDAVRNQIRLAQKKRDGRTVSKSAVEQPVAADGAPRRR
jgi:hypothetical protein